MAKKIIFLIIALALVLAAAAAQAAEPGEIRHVCLELNHSNENIGPLYYDLSLFYLGHDHYLISGHKTASHAVNGATWKRAVVGGAILDGRNMEINLQETDISDRVNTEVIEGLNVTELHMIVDKDTLGGTFQLVFTVYSGSGAEDSELSESYLSGTVSLVTCQ